ncbi:MAG: helix-turn-helix transcriptional regulator [Bacteroidales bacterium]|nr:helix-turn-helix transcriptional regulator [Bacteroidales bacterium]MBQ9710936.1 helix-turn-helix transcriptional regulator [Bacteroidales bacterium]
MSGAPLPFWNSTFQGPCTVSSSSYDTGRYSKVKALTGHSPQTYINTYRMNVAMEMLKTGEFTIAEVADSVGSSSVSNFSRDFKKHFGITPSSV